VYIGYLDSTVLYDTSFSTRNCTFGTSDRDDPRVGTPRGLKPSREPRLRRLFGLEFNPSPRGRSSKNCPLSVVDGARWDRRASMSSPHKTQSSITPYTSVHCNVTQPQPRSISHFFPFFPLPFPLPFETPAPVLAPVLAAALGPAPPVVGVTLTPSSSPPTAPAPAAGTAPSSKLISAPPANSPSAVINLPTSAALFVEYFRHIPEVGL
jgi:hypothetical protein